MTTGTERPLAEVDPTNVRECIERFVPVGARGGRSQWIEDCRGIANGSPLASEKGQGEAAPVMCTYVEWLAECANQAVAATPGFPQPTPTDLARAKLNAVRSAWDTTLSVCLYFEAARHLNGAGRQDSSNQTPARVRHAESIGENAFATTRRLLEGYSSWWGESSPPPASLECALHAMAALSAPEPVAFVADASVGMAVVVNTVGTPSGAQPSAAKGLIARLEVQVCSNIGEHEGLEFVSHGDSAFLPVDADFRHALESAACALRKRHHTAGDGRYRNSHLVWRVVPLAGNVLVTSIGGGSAGLAFALAGHLALHPLYRLWQPKVLATARIGSDGDALGLVGGIPVKLDAAIRHPMRPYTIFALADDESARRELKDGGFRPLDSQQPQTTEGRLELWHRSDDADRFGAVAVGSVQSLFDDIDRAYTASPLNNPSIWVRHHPTPDEAKRVENRLAECVRSTGGVLYKDTSPLRVHGGGDRSELRLGEALEQILRRIKVAAEHPGLDNALVVTGKSGSGKSTLLREQVSRLNEAAQQSGSPPYFLICRARDLRDTGECARPLLDQILDLSECGLSGEDRQTLYSLQQRDARFLSVFIDGLNEHPDPGALFAAIMKELVFHRFPCVMTITDDAWHKLAAASPRIRSHFDSFVYRFAQGDERLFRLECISFPERSRRLMTPTGLRYRPEVPLELQMLKLLSRERDAWPGLRRSLRRSGPLELHREFTAFILARSQRDKAQLAAEMAALESLAIAQASGEPASRQDLTILRALEARTGLVTISGSCGSEKARLFHDRYAAALAASRIWGDMREEAHRTGQSNAARNVAAMLYRWVGEAGSSSTRAEVIRLVVLSDISDSQRGRWQPALVLPCLLDQMRQHADTGDVIASSVRCELDQIIGAAMLEAIRTHLLTPKQLRRRLLDQVPWNPSWCARANLLRGCIDDAFRVGWQSSDRKVLREIIRSHSLLRIGDVVRLMDLAVYLAGLYGGQRVVAPRNWREQQLLVQGARWQVEDLLFGADREGGGRVYSPSYHFFVGIFVLYCAIAIVPGRDAEAQHMFRFLLCSQWPIANRFMQSLLPSEEEAWYAGGARRAMGELLRVVGRLLIWPNTIAADCPENGEFFKPSDRFRQKERLSEVVGRVVEVHNAFCDPRTNPDDLLVRMAGDGSPVPDVMNSLPPQAITSYVLSLMLGIIVGLPVVRSKEEGDRYDQALRALADRMTAGEASKARGGGLYSLNLVLSAAQEVRQVSVSKQRPDYSDLRSIITGEMLLKMLEVGLSTTRETKDRTRALQTSQAISNIVSLHELADAELNSGDDGERLSKATKPGLEVMLDLVEQHPSRKELYEIAGRALRVTLHHSDTAVVTGVWRRLVRASVDSRDDREEEFESRLCASLLLRRDQLAKELLASISHRTDLIKLAHVRLSERDEMAKQKKKVSEMEQWNRVFTQGLGTPWLRRLAVKHMVGGFLDSKGILGYCGHFSDFCMGLFEGALREPVGDETLDAGAFPGAGRTSRRPS